MATKNKTKEKRQRMFSFGNNLVLTINDEIVCIVDVGEEEFKKAIDYQLEIKEEIKPRVVFINAVTSLTGIPFIRLGTKIEGKTIHESEFYRRYAFYISEKTHFYERMEKIKERKEGQNNEKIRADREYREYMVGKSQAALFKKAKSKRKYQ